MAGIDLGPHFNRFVQEQIEQGRFESAEEVVKAGLRLLEERDGLSAERLKQLKWEIDEAFDQPAPGRPAGHVFDDIEARYRDDMKQAPEHGA